MEVQEVCDQDMLVDLEKGNCLMPKEDNKGMKFNPKAGHTRTKPHSSYDDLVALKDDKIRDISCFSSHCRDSTVNSGEPMTSEGEIKVGILDKSAADKEKKKWYKKPPRPPRPSSLDPADQKLISELSELAVLKRARIERMKALKKMKNSKPASSIGNLVALIITIIFCFFIIWQDFCIILCCIYVIKSWQYTLADEIKHWVFSRHGANISFHRPSISSVRMHGGLISIQFYTKNVTAISPHSSPAALNNTRVATRLEIHGEIRSVTE